MDRSGWLHHTDIVQLKLGRKDDADSPRPRWKRYHQSCGCYDPLGVKSEAVTSCRSKVACAQSASDQRGLRVGVTRSRSTRPKADSHNCGKSNERNKFNQPPTAAWLHHSISVARISDCVSSHCVDHPVSSSYGVNEFCSVHCTIWVGRLSNALCKMLYQRALRGPSFANLKTLAK